MKKKVSFVNTAFLGLIVILAALTVTESETFKNGAASGIILCTQVVIPSLFPFTVCILFIQKSSVTESFNFLSPITYKVLGVPAPLFVVMIFSMVGGYPIGAKLLNDLVKSESITPKDASKMLDFCVNAGPAFIVGAVGAGILKSKFIGYVLLICQIFSSLIICGLKRLLSKERIEYKAQGGKILRPGDNFVISTTEAATALGKICAFVVLFSAICSYVFTALKAHKALRLIGLLLEVTNACTKTRNIYLLAFLLGFGGVCVWLQIFSVAPKIKINPLKFCAFRILHGFLSAALVKIFFKISGLAVPTLSALNHNSSLFYSTPALAVSMLVMCIIFLISISGKKYVGKMLDDVV